MGLISVVKISKIFQENSMPVHALNNVSVEVNAGDFTALCGPSGSGKTTLLNLIGCLDRPTHGKIFFDGKEISQMSQANLTAFRLHAIGFIFQDYNLIPTFTAVENIEYVLWLQGVKADERRKRANEIAKRFGIGHLLGRRPAQLSRGQQQRVAVARAIVHKPKVVLGDELTANLDHKTGSELMDFLKVLNKEEGITFLYASHDPVMVDRANSVVRLQDGRLLEQQIPVK